MINTLPMYTYEIFPRQFQHCMLSECPHSATCLRFQAFKLAHAEVTTFTLLNAGMLKKRDLTHCPWLYISEPWRYTRGLNSVMDNLPNGILVKIRQELIGLLGRSNYYRHLRNEKWLDPATQSQIHEIFRGHGVEEYLVYEETRFSV